MARFEKSQGKWNIRREIIERISTKNADEVKGILGKTEGKSGKGQNSFPFYNEFSF